MRPIDKVAATTAGSLALEVLKASKDGHVCGVFSAGLAIEVGGLAILLSTDPGGWPLGIGLVSLPTSLSREWIGLVAKSSSTSLDLHDAGCQVDLSKAVVWDGGRALADLAPSSSALKHGAFLARSWLSTHPSATRMDDSRLPEESFVLPQAQLVAGAFERHIASALDQLIDGLLRRAEATWSAGVEALLGAGPGLTPAGDDVLVGLVLALRSAGDDRISILPELRTLILRLAPLRTTLYGASALHAACLGQAPEIVVGALAALFNDPGKVPSALNSLSEMGATSGYDTLLGLSAGLELVSLPSSPGQRPRSPRM